LVVPGLAIGYGAYEEEWNIFKPVEETLGFGFGENPSPNNKILYR
jgi:hypothetical protein